VRPIPDGDVSSTGSYFTTGARITCKLSPAENKYQKAGVFLATKIVAAELPRQPHKSPQMHHDLPRKNTSNSNETPVKTHIRPRAIFYV
jgi:hypothetical protein